MLIMMHYAMDLFYRLVATGALPGASPKKGGSGAVEAGVASSTQHSPFELFCLNCDLVPHLTSIAIVRRIAQFVR